jgi:heterodisulfide reductase subunit A
MEIRPDLLILATAVVPPEKNPISALFKVPVNKDGFFAEAHVKLRPIDFATDGVFLCGLAHSPKPMDESIAQGLGAAARAVTLLSQKEMFGSAIVASIDPQSCVGCQGCLKVCPYEAIRYLEDKRICEINEVICKGCGACAATCQSASAQLRRFTSGQIYAQIEKAMTA